MKSSVQSVPDGRPGGLTIAEAARRGGLRLADIPKPKVKVGKLPLLG